MNAYPRFEVVKPEYRKHLGAEIKLPMRADKNSMGYDFFSPCDAVVPAKGAVMLWTDVKVYMPEIDDKTLPSSVMGFVINTRSSMGRKGIVLQNTQGWIDKSFWSNPDNDGNIGLCLQNMTSRDYEIKEGDKIAQGAFVICPTINPETEVFQHDERLGGFGSSGR